MHTAGHTEQQRQTTLGTCTNTNGTSSLILYPSLAAEGEGALVGNPRVLQIHPVGNPRALQIHPVAAQGWIPCLPVCWHLGR